MYQTVVLYTVETKIVFGSQCIQRLSKYEVHSPTALRHYSIVDRPGKNQAVVLIKFFIQKVERQLKMLPINSLRFVEL